jgi:hypothetical protein
MNSTVSTNKRDQIIQRILAVITFIVALFSGASLNGFIVEMGPKLIPPPPGADFTTQAGLIHSMKLMEPKHFIAPFLAHALGTLLTSIILVLFVKNLKQLKIYLITSTSLFFLGGAYMVYLLPSPMWFNSIDLIFAYFPMALIPYYLKTRA